MGPNPVFAQPASPAGGDFVLPKPGMMVNLSPAFIPAHLQGLTIHPDDPFKFDFLIHKGDGHLSQEQKRVEYTKLIKYFLASLTIPDNDQWVNLSPYEHNRIIADNFAKTEMGRDLLGQDYLLKQITSSLIYPEKDLGKKFWDKVYERAWRQYGTTNIPVNTFNKVWIIPDQAAVYESGNTVYILRNHLKVMLEEDYLALSRHSEGVRSTTEESKGILRSFANAIASKVIREIILPALEKEVNEGKNFAQLRQIYSGMILATWYKKVLKESLLGIVYANKAKITGLGPHTGHSSLFVIPAKAGIQKTGSPIKTFGDDIDSMDVNVIYQRYLKAFKKGVFNYIKEDADKYTNEIVPRKYFSGGAVDFAQVTSDVTSGFHDAAVLVLNGSNAAMLPSSDRAIISGNSDGNAQNIDRVITALDSTGIQRTAIKNAAMLGSIQEQPNIEDILSQDEINRNLIELKSFKTRRERLSQTVRNAVVKIIGKPVEGNVYVFRETDSMKQLRRMIQMKILSEFGGWGVYLIDSNDLEKRIRGFLFAYVRQRVSNDYILSEVEFRHIYNAVRDRNPKMKDDEIRNEAIKEIKLQSSFKAGEASSFDGLVNHFVTQLNVVLEGNDWKPTKHSPTGSDREDTLLILQDTARAVKKKIDDLNNKDMKHLNQWLADNPGETDEVANLKETKEGEALRQLDIFEELIKSLNVKLEDIKPIVIKAELEAERKNMKFIDDAFYDLLDKLTKMRSLTVLESDLIDEAKKAGGPLQKGISLDVSSVRKFQACFQAYFQMVQDILEPDKIDRNLNHESYESRGFPEYIYYFLIPATDAAMNAADELISRFNDSLSENNFYIMQLNDRGGKLKRKLPIVLNIERIESQNPNRTEYKFRVRVYPFSLDRAIQQQNLEEFPELKPVVDQDGVIGELEFYVNFDSNNRPLLTFSKNEYSKSFWKLRNALIKPYLTLIEQLQNHIIYFAQQEQVGIERIYALPPLETPLPPRLQFMYDLSYKKPYVDKLQWRRSRIQADLIPWRHRSGSIDIWEFTTLRVPAAPKLSRSKPRQGIFSKLLRLSDRPYTDEMFALMEHFMGTPGIEYVISNIVGNVRGASDYAAELYHALLLQEDGYRIFAFALTTHGLTGEGILDVDIVAEREGTIYLVEVKNSQQNEKSVNYWLSRILKSKGIKLDRFKYFLQNIRDHIWLFDQLKHLYKEHAESLMKEFQAVKEIKILFSLSDTMRSEILTRRLKEFSQNSGLQASVIYRPYRSFVANVAGARDDEAMIGITREDKQEVGVSFNEPHPDDAAMLNLLTRLIVGFHLRRFKDNIRRADSSFMESLIEQAPLKVLWRIVELTSEDLYKLKDRENNFVHITVIGNDGSIIKHEGLVERINVEARNNTTISLLIVFISPKRLSKLKMVQFIFNKQGSEWRLKDTKSVSIRIDSAMSVDHLGGIDLNSANLNFQIKRDGKGVPLPFVQQDMAQLSRIQGFEPRILKIEPAAGLPIFSELQQKLQSASG